MAVTLGMAHLVPPLTEVASSVGIDNTTLRKTALFTTPAESKAARMSWR